MIDIAGPRVFVSTRLLHGAQEDQRAFKWARTLEGGAAMHEEATRAGDCPWLLLEKHFQHHARLIQHFRNTDAADVLAMWESGTNSGGERLSQFERDALVERHCELFGSWPE
jgi:hypothetical protein